MSAPLSQPPVRTHRTVFVAAAGFLIVLGIGSYYLWHLPSDPVPDLNYLPNDSFMVIAIKMDEGMSSAAVTALRAEFPDLDKTGLPALGQFGLDIGLSMETASSVLVGVARPAGAAPPTPYNTAAVSVVRTRKPVTAQDILNRLRGPKVSDYRVGRHTIYARSGDAFCVPAPGVVVVASPERLTAILKRGGPPELSEGLRASLKEADLSRPLAIAVDPRFTGVSEWLPGVIPGPPHHDDRLAGGALTLNVAGVVADEFRLKTVIVYKDAASARAAQQVLEENWEKAQQEWAKLKENKDIPPALVEQMQSQQTEVKENRIEMSRQLTVSVAVQLGSAGRAVATLSRSRVRQNAGGHDPRSGERGYGAEGPAAPYNE